MYSEMFTNGHKLELTFNGTHCYAKGPVTLRRIAPTYADV